MNRLPSGDWNRPLGASDDRIPPRESAVNDYSFPMATGAVTAEATLYYRSCSEEMAEEAGVEMPAIGAAVAGLVLMKRKKS